MPQSPPDAAQRQRIVELPGGLVWEGRSAEPIILPLPDGFTGFGIHATNINNASNGLGIILGTIDGMVPNGSGGWHDALLLGSG